MEGLGSFYTPHHGGIEKDKTNGKNQHRTHACFSRLGEKKFFESFKKIGQGKKMSIVATVTEVNTRHWQTTAFLIKSMAGM